MGSFAGVRKAEDDPLGDDVVITGHRATEASEAGEEEVLEPEGDEEEDL